MKRLGKAFLLIILIAICSGCSSKENKKIDLLGIDFDTKENTVELSKYKTENPLVAMYIENYGAIVMELYPDKAPNTVNNFISLVSSGFYDDNSFHRLVPGFVLQGGDPNGDGLAYWPEADENMGYIQLGNGISTHDEELTDLEKLMMDYTVNCFNFPVAD